MVHNDLFRVVTSDFIRPQVSTCGVYETVPMCSAGLSIGDRWRRSLRDLESHIYKEIAWRSCLDDDREYTVLIHFCQKIGVTKIGINPI